MTKRERSCPATRRAWRHSYSAVITTDGHPLDLADFSAGLPKCELHVHLEGVKVTINSDDPAHGVVDSD